MTQSASGFSIKDLAEPSAGNASFLCFFPVPPQATHQTQAPPYPLQAPLARGSGLRSSPQEYDQCRERSHLSSQRQPSSAALGYREGGTATVTMCEDHFGQQTANPSLSLDPSFSSTVPTPPSSFPKPGGTDTPGQVDHVRESSKMNGMPASRDVSVASAGVREEASNGRAGGSMSDGLREEEARRDQSEVDRKADAAQFDMLEKRSPPEPVVSNLTDASPPLATPAFLPSAPSPAERQASAISVPPEPTGRRHTSSRPVTADDDSAVRNASASTEEEVAWCSGPPSYQSKRLKGRARPSTMLDYSSASPSTLRRPMTRQVGRTPPPPSSSPSRSWTTLKPTPQTTRNATRRNEALASNTRSQTTVPRPAPVAPAAPDSASSSLIMPAGPPPPFTWTVEANVSRPPPAVPSRGSSPELPEIPLQRRSFTLSPVVQRQRMALQYGGEGTFDSAIPAPVGLSDGTGAKGTMRTETDGNNDAPRTSPSSDLLSSIPFSHQAISRGKGRAATSFPSRRGSVHPSAPPLLPPNKKRKIIQSDEEDDGREAEQDYKEAEQN